LYGALVIVTLAMLLRLINCRFIIIIITIIIGTNGATTLSRINFSGYVGHVTIFSSMLTIARCLVVGMRLGLG